MKNRKENKVVRKKGKKENNYINQKWKKAVK